MLRLPWGATSRLPKGNAIARALPLDRDAATEVQFEIPSGMISRLRPRGRVPFEAIGLSSDNCLGFALFDASHPRARPFRVVTLDAVAPLLDVLRPLAGSSPHIDLVIENDRRLADMLEDAGASIRLETSQMQAPL